MGLEHRSTFSLIGDQYLDTVHDCEYLDRVENALASRGITGLHRAAFEYVAASSLWWNIFWWDWVSLDEFDVRLGWLLNLYLFIPVALIAGILAAGAFIVGLWPGIPPACGDLTLITTANAAAVATFGFLHAITTILGFLMRQGTTAN